MRFMNKITNFLRKTEHSIQEFVLSFVVDIDNNATPLQMAKAMLKNSPALFYLTLKGIIKGSLRFIAENPKKAALLLLSYSSPTVIAPHTESNIHIAKPGEDLNSMLPSTFSGMSTQARLLRCFYRITIIEQHDRIEFCEKKIAKIVKLAEELPFSKKHISVAIAHQDFRLHCASPETIAKKANIPVKDQKNLVALFYPQTETLYFPDVETKFDSPRSTFSLSMLNHELIHAVGFYVNQGKCRTAYLSEAHVPVYPVTPENIKNYEQALKSGDNRIKEFSKLRQLQKNGRINRKEIKLLNKYTQAAKNCLTKTWMSKVSQDIVTRYKEHVKIMQQINKITPFILETSAGVVEVLSLVKDDNVERAVMRHIDSIDTVLDLPSFVEEQLSNPIYRNRSPSYLLAEREAYTLENLSEEAFSVFYEEASILRQQHLTNCMSEELVQEVQQRQKFM